jgi:hypothetical protein
VGVVPLSVPGAVAELLEAQGEVSTGRPCLSCGEPWLSRIRDYLDAPFHPDWPEGKRLSVAGIYRALERAHEYAHALSWHESEMRRADDHDAEWGVAYSRVWRVVTNHLTRGKRS